LSISSLSIVIFSPLPNVHRLAFNDHLHKIFYTLNFLIPVLADLIEQFPFTILGFHSDNGSEFINRNVAALLNKLLIEMTKSRPRHSNDNALAESKNGSIVRKHLGYTHIPQRHAPLINRFLTDHLNPYINYHRPCY